MRLVMPPDFHTQRNPLDSFQNNPRNQVSATLGNHANAVTVCIPEQIRDTNGPEQLPSEWAAVTLSRSESRQWQCSI